MKRVNDALSHWPIRPTHVALAAERENKVYRVATPNGDYALRQHRTGYRTNPQLASELSWMAALEAAGLNVPQPIEAKDGDHLVVIDGVQFDMLSWLPGKQLGAHGTPLDLEHPERTFHTLGQSMARLHLASDAWTPPADFTRPNWDSDGLLGETPLWGRFWENPTLAHGQKELLETFRTRATAALAKGDHDYGLIHADLLRENVLVDGDTLHLIDFDDGCHGYRLFELATTIFRLKGEPMEAALTTALIDGYQSVRPINITHLPLFIALRACTYVGWIVTRMDIPNAEQRNVEHIANATQAVANWLEKEPAYV
ncbi:homoserine kinase [Amylibacter sp. IMCC11727]|uniref:phosphotransferase enzyme family protein n=1 Tax=Amylibacter sp. IMCC11727 TaxID=3039851 RepID=UPI00244E0B8E|nr:homoserine kinase [Amylibacter sp. IMCC11727]WGI22283.1 homoserine kinase [Amylibacter sp. IMCC11727]